MLFGDLAFAFDFNVIASQASSQPSVLPFFADGERELIVVDDDFGVVRLFVYGDLLDLGWRERTHHIVFGVFGKRHDVYFFAPQLVHHDAHTAASGTHAGAYGVDILVVGHHGDLGAMPRLTGARHYLHRAFHHLWHFKLKQPADEAGVGAAHHYLRASVGTAHLHEIRLESGVGFQVLKRHLLGTGQQSLHAAEVEQGEAAVALLDYAGDDVAFPPCVFFVFVDVDDLTDALRHHLAESLGGDSAELVIVGSVVKLFADGFAVFVRLAHIDDWPPSLHINLHAGVLVGAFQAAICRFQSDDKSFGQLAKIHALLFGDGFQSLTHLLRVHALAPCFFALSPVAPCSLEPMA